MAKIIFKAIAFLPSVLFGRRRESAGESEEKILSQSMAARRSAAEVSRAPVPAQRVEPVEIAAPPRRTETHSRARIFRKLQELTPLLLPA